MSLKKKDPSLRVAANDPHLVSLGGGRLSTAVTIHYIPIGDTTIGSSTTCSISLNGSGVRQTHCTIYRSEENEVTIVPEMDARILIDGTKITGEANLTQGAMITIGNSNYLRFNNPAEAQLIRSAMGSNERMSMPQIDFTQVQRNSDRCSNSSGSMGGNGGGVAYCRQSIDIESFYETMINPKSITNDITKHVTANNYESQQQQQQYSTMKPCSSNVGTIDINGLQCPKVFTADLVTVNTPAKDVLGPKYANFARNLAENHRNEKNINNSVKNNKMTALKAAAVAVSLESSSTSLTDGGTSASLRQHFNNSGSTELLMKVNNTSTSSGGGAGVGRHNTSTTNATSYHHHHHNHHHHSTIPAYDRYPKPGTYGGLQLFPMNGVNTEINNSSSSLSSSPPILSHNKQNTNYEASPNHNNSSSKLIEQHQQHFVQKNISNISTQESERVDEILKICTEYDRQNQSITSSPIVQNRIKTNGSLPRDKKPFYPDLSSPQNHSLPSSSSSSSYSSTTTTTSHQQKVFFPEKSKPPPPLPPSTTTTSGYENVRLVGDRRIEFGGNVKMGSSPKTGYENVIVGKYVPQSPRTKIRTTCCMSPKKDANTSFGSNFSQLNYQSTSSSYHHQHSQQQNHSNNDYEQLIQTFEEKLKMEMQAIEESSKYQPASSESSPAKRPNKNINNLTLNLNSNSKTMRKPEPAPRTTTNASSAALRTTIATAEATATIEGEMNVEKLQKLRKETVAYIQKLNSQIAELRQQEDEVLRELDMEKAFLSAELSSLGETICELEKNLIALQNKIHRLEAQRNATRVMEENQQAKLKQSIEMKQDQVARLKSVLKNSPNDDCLKGELHNTFDSLENDRKTFEDLEFQYLEEESEWQAYREDLHMESKDLSMKIEEKRIEMCHLEKQEAVTQNNASTDAKALRNNLITVLNALQEHQKKLNEIENKLSDVTGQLSVQSDPPSSVSSADEDDNEEVSSNADDNDTFSSHDGKEGGADSDSSPALQIGVMSQSLFGSAELLCPKRATDDIMSKSMNENMFYNNKIELPAHATSTPMRQQLQVVHISDDLVSNTPPTINRALINGNPKRNSLHAKSVRRESNANQKDPLLRLKYNMDPGSDSDRVNFNLSLGSDDFEVNPLEKRVPSQDDIDRISKVTSDAPISTKGASTKIFDSIKEIERNRQLLLAQQGHHVIEHERQKMMDLKKKSHDEARAQYLSMLSCSLESSSQSSGNLQQKQEQQPQLEETDHLTDKENQQQNDLTEKCSGDQQQKSSSQNRHSQPELETQRSRPLSEANSELSCDLLSNNTYKSSIEILTATTSGIGSGSGDNRYSAEQNSDDAKRSSVNSNETTTSGSERLTSGNKRSLPKHQRPLTRYLPIFSPDLNLRHHIESAGHQISLCPHVFVDSYSCRGYLHKLGATFHGWARRWFVLDRQRNAFIYYSDKSERKPRGGAYFSTIDEVYLDHLNASKSGRPHCTLIVKTKKRSYHLQAASDAAARIWIDAIITGAQGNLDY